MQVHAYAGAWWTQWLGVVPSGWRSRLSCAPAAPVDFLAVRKCRVSLPYGRGYRRSAVSLTPLDRLRGLVRWAESKSAS